MNVFTRPRDSTSNSISLPARRFRYRSLHRKFASYTMIPHHFFWKNLELAWQFRDIPGMVVECGVWRGGMSAAMAALLGKERKYYLFDSFEGLPAPTEIDGPAATAWAQDKTSATYYDNCRAEAETAAEAMRLAGVSNAGIVKGWFNETLPKFTPEEPIAILRLDGDWYDSTMCCLEHLFPHVTEGGVIIIDDYCIWDGCTRAVHDYLSREKRREPVRQFENAIPFITKF